MSQISIEAPTVDPTTTAFQQHQQQQQQQQQNNSSNALSELIGLEINPPPQQDMFSSGMFQQQFHENFGNSTYAAPALNFSGFVLNGFFSSLF